MSHILAVSGMHISYLVLGFEFGLKKFLGKKYTRVITIFILIFYLCLVGFSPSIVRAVLMGIMSILSKLIYRKNDIYTSIALSLFIILIYNPYLIFQVGLQLSYGGTLGIIFFNKKILKLFQKIKLRKRRKYIEKLQEILSVTISAQIIIFPILLFHFNTFGIYVFITNILVSIFIGPIVLLGFIFCIALFINDTIAKVISVALKIGIKILIQISYFSKLPFSKIYVATPKIWQIILYFLIVFLFSYFYSIYQKRNINMTERRSKNLIALFKYKLRKDKKKVLILLIVSILVSFTVKIISNDLKIYFIDVGQGDSTLIVTPQNKTVLIDGGGSLAVQFDVGEQTLLPYILDRGFSKIDYIFVSHFDQDHVRSDY